MTQLLQLAVIGDGKMGRAVASLAPQHGFDVVALLGEPQVLPGGITEGLLNGADVAIEFTAPGAAAANVRGCLAAGCPVVSGTTGWDAERAAVEAEVRTHSGAFLWAPNFSIGVALFARIVEDAARLVAGAGAGFDAHIVETHHKAKLDAPSGTARMLASRAGSALGREVGVTSVRTGSVPGEHVIIFDAPFEQVRLSHVARDRRVFAAGALAAARWLKGRHGVFMLDHMLEATK
ncbi:MAG TPA: dihydrodipicolinate reductase C-terminal domain-containing protein [Gemmatimonadaceae bacterium]|nr:dihydrodipicolinate reductase C-terminal domain-containing protein [Gemmatimonadaceae bacterium]